LGIDDSTDIWFAQMIGREIHVIDYIEESGHALPYYAKLIKEKDYVYGTHYLPHDAAARSLETGKTRQETLKGLGIQNVILPRHSIEDGINAVRNILPRCWFDKDKCHRGLEALRNYQRMFDPKAGVFSGKPKHDWSSHGADSFRLLALGIKEPKQEKNLPRHTITEYNIFNYGIHK
jgi:hypothetical protein